MYNQRKSYIKLFIIMHNSMNTNHNLKKENTSISLKYVRQHHRLMEATLCSVSRRIPPTERRTQDEPRGPRAHTKHCCSQTC